MQLFSSKKQLAANRMKKVDSGRLVQICCMLAPGHHRYAEAGL